jgi:hypothetical protein
VTGRTVRAGSLEAGLALARLELALYRMGVPYRAPEGPEYDAAWRAMSELLLCYDVTPAASHDHSERAMAMRRMTRERDSRSPAAEAGRRVAVNVIG